MIPPHVERSGGATLGDVSRADMLKRAPEWWRKLVDPGLRSAAAAKSAAASPPARRYCGWIAGCVAPGIAVPCFNHADRRRLREQFTPNCWARVLEQFRKDGPPVTLRWGHEGVALATTDDLTMMLNVHPVVGLVFDARLRDDAAGRLAVDAAPKQGLAVSIAYMRAKTWMAERDGVTIRVVDDCVVDHVAVLPPSQTPAYPGARCFARRGAESACPAELERDARLHAWATLKRQQGL